MNRVNSFAWNKGRHLALELMEEATGRMTEMALQEECREGRPQRNLVLEYVERAIDTDDRDVLKAFCSVLCDVVAGAAVGEAADVDSLREWSRNPVPQAVRIQGSGAPGRS